MKILLRIKWQTRFAIGNVSGQNLLINPILINDKTSETVAGKIKKLTDEFGQYVIPHWLHIAPSNGPKIKPRENAAPIHACNNNV